MTNLSFPDSELAGARVIVTGASGFIGHNLVKRLSSINAETTVDFLTCGLIDIH